MLFFMTVMVGMIGAYIATKLRIPAGAMIGSLFSVAIFNIITGDAVLPESYKVITQISTGAFIGAKIKKEDLMSLKTIIKPTIIMICLMFIINFLMGYFLHKNSDMDLATTLFSTAPGGLTDMTLIALDLGADTSKVATLQLVRLLSVISLIPIIIKALIKYYKEDDKNSEEKIAPKKLVKEKFEKEIHIKRTVVTVIIGSFFGMIGMFLKIPAGAMSLSMMAVAIYNIYTEKSYMPTFLRQLIQVLAGALIGSKMGLNDILDLKTIIFPMAIIIVGFCIMNIVLGLTIFKISDFDISTALFSAAPGGAADIAIIASELGADTPKVAIMQLIRLVSVIVFYPLLVKFILTL